MYRIFLAEDDHALAEAISRQLESWGNEVITVRDFRRVSAEFAEARPQLVLLDIMLPFYDGYRIDKKRGEREHSEIDKHLWVDRI